MLSYSLIQMLDHLKSAFLEYIGTDNGVLTGASARLAINY